ncbi:hypothetical protein [Carboxylicivirga caseinilyticus]|uniref:hypothetical protein n=1 Tax=Carboxylicivirga caseinilyticus TaxID=3417572 RepID=UPI003D3257AD|nr:hypothetical protein [Marinilabiliaceae bacterium A049]
MKQLFKRLPNLRIWLLLFLFGLSGSVLNGCTKECLTPKNEEMEMINNLDFDITIMSKGQFESMAKKILNTDRVLIEPYYYKAEFIADGGNSYIDIGDRLDYSEIIFAQSIKVNGGFWFDSDEEEIPYYPYFTAELDGVRQLDQPSQNASTVAEIKGYVGNWFRATMSLGAGAVMPLVNNSIPQSIQIIGWKAYRY